MIKKLLLPILFLVILSSTAAFAQSWVEKMEDPSVNFYDAQKAFNKKYHSKEKERQHELYKATMKQRKAQLKGNVTKLKNNNEEEDEEGELPGWEQYKRWE